MDGSRPREPRCLRREHGKKLRLELPQELSSGGRDLREILLIHQNMIDWHSCPDVRRELNCLLWFVMCVSYIAHITEFIDGVSDVHSNHIRDQGACAVCVFVHLAQT